MNSKEEYTITELFNIAKNDASWEKDDEIRKKLADALYFILLWI